MMRVSAVLLILSCILLARADMPITVTEPWGGTVWKAGTEGQVVWTVGGEIKNPVNIDLLTGQPTVATVSYNLAIKLQPQDSPFKFVCPNLPGRSDYFVRIGNEQDGYAYSHNFQLQGTGSASPDTSNGVLPPEYNYSSTARPTGTSVPTSGVALAPSSVSIVLSSGAVSQATSSGSQVATASKPATVSGTTKAPSSSANRMSTSISAIVLMIAAARMML
ncbi:uncharacterized protein VTP21DRAFT_3482 [Calcarisporiella thermophila]|uniref:uncharacterized protein n=1 Tax=Calcarisporiella thermophila TaxID=911321 RepID=UPI0037429154